MMRVACVIGVVGAALLAGASLASAERDHGRTVTSSVVIHAPAPEIFASFTTPEGIVKAWGVAQAKVDFRVGGQIRTAYQPETDLDSPKAIVNTILAYEPDRMLAIKAAAPEGAPDWLQAICETGWSVLRLEPLGADCTRVTCTGMGYRGGPLYDKAYEFFKAGNDWTLNQMKERFEEGSAAASTTTGGDAMAILRRMLGGEWVAEETIPGGGTMLARTVWREQAGGFLVVNGWLGDESGLRPHSHLVCGQDPATGGVGFWAFGEHRDIARGHVRVLGEGHLGLDWTIDAPGENGAAKQTPYHIEFAFESADAYRLSMWRGGPPGAGAGVKPDVALTYRRVPAAPAKFTRLAPER